jgi:hypothetical protein
VIRISELQLHGLGMILRYHRYDNYYRDLERIYLSNPFRPNFHKTALLERRKGATTSISAYDHISCDLYASRIQDLELILQREASFLDGLEKMIRRFGSGA